MIGAKKKKCNRCKEEKLLTKFSRQVFTTKNNTKVIRRRGICSSCQQDYNKFWSSKNPRKTKEYRKAAKLKQNYGISYEEFILLKGLQDGRCAICNYRPKNIKRDFLHLDHCHKTGKVRGLLCQKCNHGLGNFKDNVSVLVNSINYLKASSGGQ